MTRAVIHFFPVCLALFCLTLSLAYEEFYDGFSDGQPATWLSLALMLTCLALVLGSLLRGTIEAPRRRVALILTPLLVVAILDEWLQRHEAIGEFVFEHATFIPRKIRHFTDDVLIILGALFGALLLYLCVKTVSDRRSQWRYLIPIVLFAVAHGVLDLMGHGYVFLRWMFPEMPSDRVGQLVDVFSYLEETCKLWTEWFVVLFLLHFFYARRSGVLWPLAVLAGSVLALCGIWALEDPDGGIPFVFIGGSLEYVRNFHLLLGLAVVWLSWSVAVWWLLGGDRRRIARAGLFFITPYYLLLPEIPLLDALTVPLTPDAFDGWVTVGLVAGGGLGLAATLLRRRIGTAAAGLAWVPLGLVGFSVDRLGAQALLLLTVGGLLLPVAALIVVWGARRRAASAVLILLGAALIQNPLWLVAATGVFLLQATRRLDTDLPPRVRRVWVAGVALHLAVVPILLITSAPYLLPELEFRTRGMTFLDVGRQRVPLNHRPRQTTLDNSHPRPNGGIEARRMLEQIAGRRRSSGDLGDL